MNFPSKKRPSKLSNKIKNFLEENLILNENKLGIIFILIPTFILWFSPFSYVRYYYEDFTEGYYSEVFSGIAICATSEKKDGDYEVFENDSDRNVIYIPSKYRKYKFYFSGEIVNGIKDVYVSVNNEPVENIGTSGPQGMYYFWEEIFLVKRFSGYINLKSGTNVIVLKSGKAKEKIIVKVGD